MKSVCGLLLLIPVTAFGQLFTTTVSVTSGPSAAGVVSGIANISSWHVAMPAILNEPFSAEEVSERRQTTADSTPVTETKFMRRMYRNSQGRTRVERPLLDPIGNTPSPTLVEIVDPVLGTQYILDSPHKIAHRVIVRPLPASAQSRPAGRGVSAPDVNGQQIIVNGQQITTLRTQVIDLGSRMIDGITVQGVRSMGTFPCAACGIEPVPGSPDSRNGDYFESWKSPELDMVIYAKNSRSCCGEGIMRFANLSREEPAASLFLVPPDYQIVDESGPFTIPFGQ